MKMCFHGGGEYYMQNISDIIEMFLKDLLREGDGELELRRNELATKFNCAPSQINYVLSTRFTVNHGYMITSRKGGGGYIRITSIDMTRGEYLLHIINSIGELCTQAQAMQIIGGMAERGIVTQREANIMVQAVKEETLANEETSQTQVLGQRAKLLKNMLTALLDA